MKTLDRTRPFGEISGGDARRFMQDDSYFDANGNEIVDPPVSEAQPVQQDGKKKKAAN